MAETKRRAGQKASIERLAKSGLEANGPDVVEQLIVGAIAGKAGSIALLKALLEGTIKMEDLGSEKRIESLALMLAAAPEWKAEE
jgi:hypothetical protein